MKVSCLFLFVFEMGNCVYGLFHFFVIALVCEIFITGLSAVKFGLITPIEVVEEWGCHDTEFRLTCSRIDTTIAILEATFAPNCTDDPTNNTADADYFDNCAHVDLKRLTRAYITPRIDHRISETEAGRRFLEKMRENHGDDEIISKEKQPISKTSGDNLAGSGGNINNGRSTANIGFRIPLFELKRRQTALRASLEELIVEYLRGLTAEGESDLSNEYFEHNRERREKRDRRTKNAMLNDIDGLRSSVANDIEIDVLSESDKKDGIDRGRHRTEHGASITSDVDEKNILNSDGNAKVKNNNGKEQLVCTEQNRRITHLDRDVLEAAVGNESDYEHNIRRLLNYRCSGKNHCSFVFADDHPFSVLWDSGIIRIKYVCMEAYRVNKYCGQHLIVANEVQDVDSDPLPLPRARSTPDDDEERAEPVAEALIQNDQNFHHLKILTSSAERPVHVPYEPIKPTKQKNKNRRIYSQDFRMLKILPSNLDDFNDIEKIGDEFYFKKDEEFKTTELDNSLPAAFTTPDSSKYFEAYPSTHPKDIMATSMATAPAIQFYDVETNRNEIDSYIPKNVFENNILRDIRSTADYETVNGKLAPTTGILSSQQPSEHSPFQVSTPTPTNFIDAVSQTWENEILMENPNIFDELDLADKNGVTPNLTVKSNKINESHSHHNYFNIPIDNDNNLLENISENSIRIPMELDKIVISKNNGLVVKVEDIASTVDTTDASVINLNENINDSEEDDYSYEDYAVEVFGPITRRKNKMRIHTSVQKTAIKEPLLQQGFIASPGYPKFYIGESNCSWRITVPHGQKIRLTILDINLRCKHKYQVDKFMESMGCIQRSMAFHLGSVEKKDDPVCRDFIQIVDSTMGRLLFKSCSEYSRPLKIISEKNEVEVTVKTTSKLAYPKRGVLLHYTALGCLIPAPPLNGRLVYKTEYIAKYICDPAFVFPDTAVHSRELSCTSRNTWDKSLPDCVEQSFVSVIEPTSKLVSVLNRKKTDPSMTTDTVYDIVIPSLLIAGLFIVNAFVFVIIMRYRNKRNNDNFPEELADL